MKALLILAALLWSAGLGASEYIVGLPGAFPGDRDALYESLGRFILFDMEPGDSLLLYDGHGLRQLGEVAIPAKSAYRHARVRKRQYLPVLRALKAHLAALPAEGESLDALRFLDHLALNVAGPRSDENPVHVLLIGAAEHHDARTPRFDMGQARALFPSDGHLRAGLSESVYSVRDKAGRLAGYEIHWLHTTSPGDWENDLYEARVARFWALYVQLQGGRLLTFTSDMGMAFERLRQRDLPPPPSYAFDHTAYKVEMLRAERGAVATGPLSEGDAFLHDDVSIATAPPPRSTGYLKVGIRWACARCDIDLYARNGKKAEFLYFGNVETPQGRYNKDFQTSPDTTNGLEYIEFTAPVDLHDVEVLINYYAGGPIAGGPKGTVRAFFDGRVYEAPFRIAAPEGNGGKARDRALTSAHWDVIDLPAVLGLPRQGG